MLRVKFRVDGKGVGASTIESKELRSRDFIIADNFILIFYIITRVILLISNFIDQSNFKGLGFSDYHHQSNHPNSTTHQKHS